MKVLIGSYTDFNILAHKPKGLPGNGIYIYNTQKIYKQKK